MEFGDRLFCLINNLPVEPEPEHSLASGPSEPGAFQKMHEKILLDHALGKKAPPVDEFPSTLNELLTKARDYRDVPKFTTVTSRLEPLELNKRKEPEHSTSAVRYETKIVGTDHWTYGYDARGELVSAHVMDVEARELLKSLEE